VIKFYSPNTIEMKQSEYMGYCFGLVITILLIVAIFSFHYNSSVENEYFENFLQIDNQIKNL
jgi:hypothetical protein